MNAKRIRSGLYEYQNDRGQFEIDRFPDGSWVLFVLEPAYDGSFDKRSYVLDFNTKRDAMARADSYCAA